MDSGFGNTNFTGLQRDKTSDDYRDYVLRKVTIFGSQKLFIIFAKGSSYFDV